MGVRLMFSASTAITPELLVLDEVLGVGDAYFTHKSYERIRGMCAAGSTTMLLVTHDVYTAAKVCDRMIWLDHGRVLVDDAPGLVVTAYEDSIRRQEERRLRVKRLAAVSEGSDSTKTQPLLVEIRSRLSRPLPCPVYISRVSLALEGTVMDSLPIGGSKSPTAQLTHEGTAWGEVVQCHGRVARVWNNYGSVFHKVAGMFDVAGLLGREIPAFRLDLDCWSDEPCELAIDAFVGAREVHLGEFTTLGGAWQTIRASSGGGPRQTAAEPSRSLALGSGRVVIAGFQCVDDAGRVKSVFAHGEPFTLSVQYQINEPGFRDDVQVLTSFHRDGVQDVCRVFCRAITFDASRSARGTLQMHLPQMRLGAGKYTVSLGITERGYFDREQTLFYSINPGMYDCFTRGLEIEVVGGGTVGTGTGVVADAEWRLLTPDPIKV
jgi:hypothetical protein